MIEQQLANINFVGRDGFVWWIGQIPTEGTWKTNIPGKRTPTISSHEGFGYRFKVRIMGYHTHDKSLLPDDDLPWASVMYPVTAGSGAGAASQTPNLRQGNFVYGFFLDGENAQQPVIMGVIGHNQYTSISKNANSKIGYTPFGGYSPTDFVPAYAIRTTQEKPIPAATQQKSPGDPNQKSTNDKIIESDVGSTQGISDQASKKQKEDGHTPEPIKQNSDCEPIPLNDMQIKMQNMIKKIQEKQKKLNSWQATINQKISNIQNDINKEIDDAAKFVTGGVKWIIKEIQQYIDNKINNTLKDTYYTIFPNDRPTLKKAVEKANDAISCLFRKLVNSLLGIIKGFLNEIVNRFINVPLCALENFIGGLVGKLTGLISSVVDSILSPISSIIGSVFSIAGGVLSLVTNLISFLSCDEKPKCSELKTWSSWGGAAQGITGNIQNIISSITAAANTVTGAIDPNNFNFDVGFEDLFQDTCNVGAIFCGPPKVQFIGGGGFGAEGNAILNAAGQILSVDITNPGSGYQSPPIMTLADDCGNGVGAVGSAFIGNVPGGNGDTGDTGVVSVVITNPGRDYLPQPDGSSGGSGRTWAEPDQTVIRRSDGTYDLPYSPGEIVNINRGDTVQLPGQEPYVASSSDTISAPPLTREVNYNDRLLAGQGNYNVVLELSDIYIEKSGFGYQPEDKIVIAPDRGASAIPKFNDFGGLIGIDLINPGYGFKEYPDIYIESDTGYNVRLRPVFKVNRVIGNDIPEELKSGDKLISVIDCVGKFK